ncbi:glycosyltransferase family 4 protein [Stenotrophomonas maltophilia]|uniref:glycosyltransferase family 4 protein n=1 Tax=Stenotrophomonas maltophilia TaxID=40324 RepID=UPI0013DD4015|nr:glycosyltransferase family 4 protein [Stenotrophomonas maltophilia]
MNNIRHFLRDAYTLTDRLLLTRLPESARSSLVSWLLACARWIHPSGRWPTSAASLLVRRTLRAPQKHMQKLPSWAVQDLRDLSVTVDPLLAPEIVLDQRPQTFLTPVHWTQAGHAYEQLRRSIGNRQFDTVLLIPWLKRGGADLGALHHARALHEAFGQRVLVLATEPGDSPWANRLDDATPFVECGHSLATLSLPHGEPEVVLARLLVQLAPARIHIINSHTGWRMLQRFGKAIRQRTRVFASLYCDEFETDGRRTGLAQQFLPTCLPWLDAVITDNAASPTAWRDSIGVDPSLFPVVHFPAPEVPSLPPNRSINPKRLLWASRLERQKRPDLLVELASSMPEFQWDVHGAALSVDDDNLRRLKALSNVSIRGSYERFSDIVGPEHLAYIYTSCWDGLPNVLLEATASGIPVIAPQIGGISDLIPTDMLVPANASAVDYSVAVRNLMDPATRAEWIQTQSNAVSSFTWERFVASLQQIPGYAH